MNNKFGHKIVGIFLSFSFNICFAGLYAAISGKDPWPKLGKKYRLNVKIGENYQHNT